MHGKQIRRLRRSHGLTVREVAEHCPLSYQRVHQLESEELDSDTADMLVNAIIAAVANRSETLRVSA